MRKIVVLALLVPALALAIGDMKWFDLNHWRSPFYNDGRWGIDITVGTGVAAGSWPSPLHNCYVFGAGTWVGAILPSTTPETLCTVFYNPNSGGTEGYPTLCSYWRGGGDSLDRVYKYPGDWPPPASKFPMAPQDPRSDMDMWCCFCDSNPACHISPGRPLGVNVYTTVYGFADSLDQDFFFLKYELANSSGDSIRQAYFGMMLDADIGYGSDDMTGLILDHLFHVGPDTVRIKNTGFAYDVNNVEDSGSVWDSGTPGAVAVMLLSSPESLGLTAFKKLTIDIDPVTDAAQYLTLAGYDYRTGVYAPFDSFDGSTADKRALLATGPFDLAPDSTVTFWYAVIGSPYGDSGQGPNGRDTTELALRCQRASRRWDRLLGVEEQPPTPLNVQPLATIVRGVLFMEARGEKRETRSELLDISGRKVLDLHPGPNDVSRLSPGIYFVRETRAQASEGPVRKVVVTK
jgi:hypothetical protein